MSTFTDWGQSPAAGAASIPVTKFAELMDAYTGLTTRLQKHIEDNIGPGSDTHDARTAFQNVHNSIEAVRHSLENLIRAKEDKASADETKGDVVQLKENIAKAIEDIVNLKAGKADKQETNMELDSLAQRIIEANDAIDRLQETLNMYKSYFYMYPDEVLIDAVVSTTKRLVGKLHAKKIIDFTDWRTVYAPFTSVTNIDNGTDKLDGAYILGCLSKDWTDAKQKPDDGHKHKACTVYIKYVNTRPFDAIVNITVTDTGDKHTGTLTVSCSKKSGDWKNLAFHLCHGTDAEGNSAVYLTVSSDDLVKTVGSYSNAEFYVSGINFIPAMPVVVQGTNNVDYVSSSQVKKAREQGYFIPVGKLTGITTATVGTDSESSFVVDGLSVDMFRNNTHKDYDGYDVSKIVKKDVDGTDVKYLVLGDARFDEVLFDKRPGMLVENAQGDLVNSFFVTTRDLVNLALPVGAVIRWGGPKDKIPDGWLDISEPHVVSALEYPDLADVLGSDAVGDVTLPVETNSIIKAVYFDIVDKASQPNYDEVVEVAALNKKINKETERAAAAEQALGTRVDAVSDAVAEEAVRAETAELAIDAKITAETERAAAAEQELGTRIDAAAQIAADVEALDGRVTQNTEDITAARQAVQNEADRANAVERQLASAIEAESERSTEVELNLNERINNFEAMESRLQANVDAEAARALAEEQRIEGKVDAETTRAEAEEQRIEGKVDAETERAEQAEQALGDRINANHP